MKKLTINLLFLLPLSLMGAQQVSTSCVVVNDILHQPVGDESNKTVMTKRDVYRDCSTVTRAQGPCLQWQESHDEVTLPDDPEVALRYSEHSSNYGAVIANIQAIQMAQKAMFSGIRGVCEKGLTYNFDWLEDPSFWASALMSAMGTGQLGETLKGYTEGYMGCLVGGSIDMAGEGVNQMLWEPNKCDPVDEICDEKADEQDPSDVVSVTQNEWDDMVAQEPDFVNSVEVIEQGNGYVIFRYKTIGELAGDTSGLSDSDAAEAEKTAKEQRLKIKSITTGVQVTACAGGQYFDAGTVNAGSGVLDGNSVDAVVQGAMGMLPFPYGSIAQAAWKLLNSFSEIDSCHNEDDARGQGKRHEIAYRGLKFETCHPLFDECVFDNHTGVGADCQRTRYTMCCYDSQLSREMMVQMKAQLGHKWRHCTGITLEEFSTIKWRQCSESEMQSGIDGATLDGKVGDYDMTTSYQYLHNCMDMRPIINAIKKQIPSDFDDSKALDMIRDLDITSLQ